jgi:hypothetical protein
MKAALALTLFALVLWVAADHMHQRAIREGDGGSGAALISVALYILTVAFAGIGALRLIFGNSPT